MSTHIHTYTYVHTHIKCTYECTPARLERRRGSERARSRCRERKLCTSLLFDAIKPHFAPPMQGLHCTHFLKHQYPSTPHPLFPTYSRTVRRLRASAVSLFCTDQINRVHSSEEAPRSFTMAPCITVEFLEGKQRCSRAAVSEHPLICTGAEPIHQVHGPPKPRATESMLRNRIHISAIFPPFRMETWNSLRMMSDRANIFDTMSTRILSLALELVTQRRQSLSWNWVS